MLIALVIRLHSLARFAHTLCYTRSLRSHALLHSLALLTRSATLACFARTLCYTHSLRSHVHNKDNRILPIWPNYPVEQTYSTHLSNLGKSARSNSTVKARAFQLSKLKFSLLISPVAKSFQSRQLCRARQRIFISHTAKRHNPQFSLQL